MDKRTSQQLARRIEREDSGITVTGSRRWALLNGRGASYELDCVDNRNGITFVVSNPGQWGERRDDMKNAAEVDTWAQSPEGRAAMDARYAAKDTMYSWQTIGLTDADGDSIPEGHDPTRVKYLREFRKTGNMLSVFFAEPLPGQDPDVEQSFEWGPEIEQIDWTGFPADAA